jgi:hypothetical protein
MEVIPGRHVPDEKGGIDIEQFALAEGKCHDWNCAGFYMLG